MKHLLITHEFSPFRGGVATYCEETAGAGHRLGAEVEVWAPQGRGGGDASGFLFPVRRFPGNGTLQLPDLWRLARSCWGRQEEWKEAFVWLPSVGSQMVFMHLDFFCGRRPGRFGVILHGSELNRFAHNPWLRFLARRWLARAERIVGASPYALRLLGRGCFASEAARAELACCALRPEILEKALQVTIPAGAPEPPWRVLSVGRIHPRKGQLETARALALLPVELRRQVIFEVAGRGDDRYLAEVRQVCREGGLTLDYRGEASPVELDRLYRSCTLFSQPSRSLKISVEGLGMTNLEAAAYGKPVVGYDSGGVTDAVREGKTGFLVPEGDVAGLAGAITRLLRDPELRSEMGIAGRLHAQSFRFEDAATVLFLKGE